MSSAARTVACQASDDDIKEGDDAIHDCHNDGSDRVNHSHDATADGLKDRCYLCIDALERKTLLTRKTAGPLWMVAQRIAYTRNDGTHFGLLFGFEGREFRGEEFGIEGLCGSRFSDRRPGRTKIVALIRRLMQE